MPALCAALALVPFIVCAGEFRRLFWFGDEWDQLNELHRSGLWPYLTSTFAENFVPLFKTLWLSLLLLGHGSYFAVLMAVWLTHAVNVLLLGLVLRRVGLQWPGMLIALLLAGLPASNIETLGWTIQWSAVLALSFHLVAILNFLTFVERPGPPWSAVWLLALASLAGSLSFSRGVLSGCAIAFTCAIPLGIRSLSPRARALGATAALLPSLAVAIFIANATQGNHRHLMQPGVAALSLQFATHFFLLNPLQAIWSIAPSSSLLVVLGASKLAIYGIALARARGTTRWLVWLSLVLDAANAVLVGIGRYHTGLAAAVGSRYQYVPLFCLAPAAGVTVDWLASAVPRLARLTRGAALAGAATLAWSIASPWPEQMRSWSGWRGVEMRRIVQSRRDATLLPFVGTVSTAEANALRDEYHLH